LHALSRRLVDVVVRKKTRLSNILNHVNFTTGLSFVLRAYKHLGDIRDFDVSDLLLLTMKDTCDESKWRALNKGLALLSGGVLW